MFLSGFNQILSFLTDFHKSSQYQNFMKIHSVEAAVIYVDKQMDTDMMKLTSAFCNLCEHA